MKQRFILFNRAGTYYSEDTATGKQHSLRTKDKGEAARLLNAKNEAEQLPAINLQIARAYLAATDAQIATRTWQLVMDETAKLKKGSTSPFDGRPQCGIKPLTPSARNPCWKPAPNIFCGCWKTARFAPTSFCAACKTSQWICHGFRGRCCPRNAGPRSSSRKSAASLGKGDSK